MVTIIYYVMPEIRRILLDMNVFDALKAEALVRHDNLKNTLASMILDRIIIKWDIHHNLHQTTL